MTQLPTYDDVMAARGRIAPLVVRTPMLRHPLLDELTGGTILLKPEPLQRTGSFKLRGATNAILQLDESQRRAGVVTHSSGNHAQATAFAAAAVGAKATIFMPDDAPAIKVDSTRRWGAEIRRYDRHTDDREGMTRAHAESSGAVLVPPFDHPDVIAGQGTAARELFEDAGPLDLLLVPCGGGGLLSGSALAAAARGGCRVIGVEPELADDATRTFRTGSLHTVSNPATIADGLRTPSLGALTWPIIRREVSDMITVTDAEIVDAMRFLWARMKLVVEPSGAVAVAALFRYGPMGASRVGAILSGGNTDLETACALFQGALPARSDRGVA
jgi:threonine dehydratase